MEHEHDSAWLASMAHDGMHSKRLPPLSNRADVAAGLRVVKVGDAPGAQSPVRGAVLVQPARADVQLYLRGRQQAGVWRAAAGGPSAVYEHAGQEVRPCEEHGHQV